LTGKTKILHLNGDWTEAFLKVNFSCFNSVQKIQFLKLFKEGVMHGFSRTFDTKGRLKLVGNYKNGRRSGVWWKMIRGKSLI